jgi:hypothetical protein
MRAKVIVLFLVMAFGGWGCGTTTMYYWGDYEDSLYNYYKNPAEVEELTETLAVIIEKGKPDGRVPPGIYAEYGYLLLISGNTGEAIVYFKKERSTWPESCKFMDRMIAITKASDDKKATQDAEEASSGGADR